MSRIGKKHIEVPGTIKVNITPASVQMQAGKNELKLDIPAGIKVEMKDKITPILHTRPDHQKERTFTQRLNQLI